MRRFKRGRVDGGAIRISSTMITCMNVSRKDDHGIGTTKWIPPVRGMLQNPTFS